MGGHARDRIEHPGTARSGAQANRGPIQNWQPEHHGDWHRWHGEDLHHWQHGRWHHGYHGDNYGWWWVSGDVWFPFTVPVYPYPDFWTPESYDVGYYYWCESLQAYYPYVTDCPEDWVVVPEDAD